MVEAEPRGRPVGRLVRGSRAADGRLGRSGRLGGGRSTAAPGRLIGPGEVGRGLALEPGLRVGEDDVVLPALAVGAGDAVLVLAGVGTDHVGFEVEAETG